MPLVMATLTRVVVRLSAAVPVSPLLRCATVNVHGVDERFFHLAPVPAQGFYFLGSLLRRKGLPELRDLLAAAGLLRLDVLEVFGDGTDASVLKSACPEFSWRGAAGHLDVAAKQRCLVNPSITEVLCTVTAEALAAGRFVLLPRHSSNAFFEEHPNALFYDDVASFRAGWLRASTDAPAALTLRRSEALFGWEAATERFVSAVEELLES